jgi:hypothetical protein
MANKTDKTASTSLSLPKMTSSALKGKQSVRTNFKLSDACIQAINIVSTQLGLKHRSIFDYLVEDTDALKAIAEDIGKSDNKQDEKSQKSYIISRETLKRIDDTCDDLNISRDTLIEHSVRRLLPIIEKEIENHRKRKNMLEMVNKHFKDGRLVLNKIKDSVGADDPIYRAFKNSVSTCKQVNTQIGHIVSKGKVLKGFDPESLKR